MTAAPGRALVTGASSGIGAEIAAQLAARGWSLVLTARRADRLRELSTRLGPPNNVDVVELAVDLAAPDGAARVAAAVAGLDVDLLVNNAGVGAFGRTDEIPPEDQAEMVDLNCRALLELSTRLLPPMIARRRGAILNVGSVAGFLPGPFMAGYFASKAFVLSLTVAMAEELRGTGVTVTCLAPGPVRTEFGGRKTLARRKGDSPGHLPVERVAREGIDAALAGRLVVVPGAPMKGVALATALLPRRLVTRLLGNAQRRRR